MKIFSTFQLNSHTIKNRIVFPPVVSFNWTNGDGFVSEKHILHYEKMAKSGAGIIIVEATCIEKSGMIIPSQLGIWSDEHINGFKKLVDTCKKYDCKILLQIQHSGLITNKKITENPVGPSANIDDCNSREFSTSEIKELELHFFNAAIRAKKAGFDGVELHGAHGYLLNQFANKNINKRSDEYGDSIQGRLLFAKNIIASIRKNLGADFIIDYRFGANTPTIEDGIEIAKELCSYEIDLLHVSHGGIFGIQPEVNSDFGFNWIIFMGSVIKLNVNKPVVVFEENKDKLKLVGVDDEKEFYNICHKYVSEYLIENNLTDFVAIGRDLLTDQLWLEKAISKEKINYCIQCKPGCKRRETPESCPFYK